MITNYFLTAFRNIIRHRTFSIIIVLGLTIGLAIFILIFQYVAHELSCDRFNQNFDSIYRLEYNDWALTGTAYAPEIAGQFPEVISSTRVSCWEGSGAMINIGDKRMKIPNLVYADSGFFNIFSFRFIKGNPGHAIDMPNSVVLTESTARSIFGDEDPMNKSFRVNNKEIFTVTGIIEDVNRFHLKVDALASFVSLAGFSDNPNFLNNHSSWNYYTYFNLKDKSDPVALAGKINSYYASLPRWNDSKPQFSLRPLKEIYFTHVKWDFPMTKANRSVLKLYMLIGIFILTIACINFINLTIARAANRSREIGVRKVMGARRKNLIVQFLGESVIYALIATELSLVLMNILQPVFNNLVERQLSFSAIQWWWIVFLVVLLPLLVGILAGIYPAIYLTHFRPVVTLKSEKTRGKSSLFFRYSLIVGQFTISIILIIVTLTIHKQLRHLLKADLGFSKENIINVKVNNSIWHHRDVFKSMLLSDTHIKDISFSTQTMENVTWQETIAIGADNKQYTFLGIDSKFIPLLGMRMADGRNFLEDSPADSGKVIINENAISFFELKEPVVGQILGTGEKRLEILGVVKDFHFNSLRNPIGPMIIGLTNNYLSAVNIKVVSDDIPESIAHLEKTWNAICPEYPFEYRFLDKSYEQLYNDEIRLGKQFLYLAILAIFIAAIGLLGLSSFLAEQRTKEIGIRKATGDSTFGIVLLFAGEFIKWVIISGVIAAPLSFYFMSNWLKGFASRVTIDGWILTGSCLIALVVALATVIGQTYKIAARNPVEALRYE